MVALIYPSVVGAVIFSTLLAPAAVFVPLVFALYWRRTNRRAVFAAATAVAAAQLFSGHAGPFVALDPLFVGPCVGALVLVVATLVRPSPASQVSLAAFAPGAPAGLP